MQPDPSVESDELMEPPIEEQISDEDLQIPVDETPLQEDAPIENSPDPSP